MAPATFGELADQAREALVAASAYLIAGSVPPGDVPATIGAAVFQIERIAGIIRRQVTVPAGGADPGAAATPYPWARAAGVAHRELAQAADSLRGEAIPESDDIVGSAHPSVRSLMAAAAAITAANDLFATHFAPGGRGAPLPRSHWAPTLTSQPVTAARLIEAGQWARQLAVLTAVLSQDPSHPLPRDLRGRVDSAYLHLSAAASAIEAAASDHAPPPVYGDLLRAIPVAGAPPRHPARKPESVSELAAQLAVTTERMRAILARPGDNMSWSRQVSAEGWQWTAQAAAVTGHCSSVILHTLVSATEHLAGADAAATVQTAARATDRLWPAWRHVAAAWGPLITDTPVPIQPPLAADLIDLILRTGRLAYANPAWTPAWTQHAPPREPAGLAPNTPILKNVLAAVHHTADTIGRLAAREAHGVSAAAKAQRLYVSARLRPNTPREGARVFVHADREHVRALLGAYDGTCDASAEAAAVLDTVAIALHAPSCILAAARLATTDWREEPALHRHTPPAWKHAFPHGPAAPPEAAPQPGSSSLTRHGPRASRYAATP